MGGQAPNDQCALSTGQEHRQREDDPGAVERARDTTGHTLPPAPLPSCSPAAQHRAGSAQSGWAAAAGHVRASSILRSLGLAVLLQ